MFYNLSSSRWRRRVSEHLKNKGDMYFVLLISLLAKFDVYSNFLFISITLKCAYNKLFAIEIIFLAVHLLADLSIVIHLTKLIKEVANNKDEIKVSKQVSVIT